MAPATTWRTRAPFRGGRRSREPWRCFLNLVEGAGVGFAQPAAIAALIDEWRPLSLVVGLPLATDGSEHAMSARCMRFANQLRGRFGLPVDYAEERLTSVEAEQRLREGGHSIKSAREQIDSVAAQIILQCYFDNVSEHIS